MEECIDHGLKGNDAGYGQRWVSDKRRYSHRLAYADANGLNEATMGGVAMHSCDNPRCINPTHLSLGTYQTNADDKVTKGRQAKGSDVGTSKLSLDVIKHIRNIYVKGCKSNGQRPLSRLYNVTQATIYSIVHDLTWRE